MGAATDAPVFQKVWSDIPQHRSMKDKKKKWWYNRSNYIPVGLSLFTRKKENKKKEEKWTKIDERKERTEEELFFSFIFFSCSNQRFSLSSIETINSSPFLFLFFSISLFSVLFVCSIHVRHSLFLCSAKMYPLFWSYWLIVDLISFSALSFSPR